jgi:hypothetical protein
MVATLQKTAQNFPPLFITGGAFAVFQGLLDVVKNCAFSSNVFEAYEQSV